VPDGLRDGRVRLSVVEGAKMRRFMLAMLLCCACAPAAEEGGGAGGGGPGGAGGGGGTPGCVDLSAEGSCRADTEEGGCSATEVCTISSQPCGDEACCTAPYRCAPRPLTGRPGGYSCVEDDDCVSGVCLASGGVGVCLRACQPAAGVATRCPPTTACRLVPLADGATVYSCIGVTEAGELDAAATFCLSDEECLSGRTCQALNAEQYLQGLSVAICRPAELAVQVGISCSGGAPVDEPFTFHGTNLSPRCGGGAICYDRCEGMADVCLCDDAEYAADGCARDLRCSRPCRRDTDCPSPYVCSEPDDFYRIPTNFPDLLYGFCRLSPSLVPETVCLDELDCCKDGLQRDGRPCCDAQNDGQGGLVCAGVRFETTVCRLAFDGAPGKWNGRCAVPGGGLALGDPCETHEACESRLCAPDGAGGARCSSVCDPLLDACGQLLPGTSCGAIEVPAPDGAPVCVRACVAEGVAACAG